MVIDQLRMRIAEVERCGRPRAPTLPFGVPDMDARLPRGGLALGALHEVTGGGEGALHGAAAALFVAGVLARLKGPVLWGLHRRDLFAPALWGVGLHPERVIYAQAADEKGVLSILEEGLRHAGLAGVVGEIGALTPTASRRLQLAAETSGVAAFVIRRWRATSGTVDFGQPTAATTRWRVTAVPSQAAPVGSDLALSAPPLSDPLLSDPLLSDPLLSDLGRARWRVEMMRCRGAEGAEWELEACDEAGRLAVPAELAHRSPATGAASPGRFAA